MTRRGGDDKMDKKYDNDNRRLPLRPNYPRPPVQRPPAPRFAPRTWPQSQPFKRPLAVCFDAKTKTEDITCDVLTSKNISPGSKCDVLTSKKINPGSKYVRLADGSEYWLVLREQDQQE